MRTRTISIIVAAVLLTPIVLIALGIELLFGVSQSLFAVRYRIAATVEVADGDRLVRNVVHNDCRGFYSTRGIVQGAQQSRRGEDNHVVLQDGSILMLPNLEPCRWIEPKPAPGTSFVLDPLIPGYAKGAPGHAKLWAKEAWRFDNVDEPSRVAVHDLPWLFQHGSGGLKIERATTTVVASGRQTPVAFELEDRFPWLRKVQHPDRLASYEDRRNFHQLGNFLGFRVTVTQLVGGSRCAAPDPEAEGPIAIPRDAPCVFVNECQRGGDNLYCGRIVGWLAGTANADFSELSFSIDRRSDGIVAVLYRELMLKKSAAPGERKHQDLRWKPRICVDGSCIAGEVVGIGGPTWHQFYYPKRNQFVTVWPLTFYAAGAFRRAGASY